MLKLHFCWARDRLWLRLRVYSRRGAIKLSRRSYSCPPWLVDSGMPWSIGWVRSARRPSAVRVHFSLQLNPLPYKHAHSPSPIHHYPIHPSTNSRSNAPPAVTFQEHCSLWNGLPCTIVLFTLGQLCVNPLLANMMTVRLHQEKGRRHQMLWHSMTFSLTLTRGRGSQLERAMGHRTIVNRTITQYRA